MHPVRILPAGDAALLVALPPAIDPEVNAWCIAFADSVSDRYGTALRDAVVGYCSVTVSFDPAHVDPAWLERELQECADALPAVTAPDGAHVDIPVLYGGAFGPDLEDVARFAGATSDEVVSRHAAVSYRVYLVGFVPGFAYLAEVDSRIAAPRRAVPRTSVPAGSVAIAGGQTGIYPDSTPGGWNIIGRTPLRLFDPSRPEPSLLRPGDEVRFHPIDEPEFTRRAIHSDTPERQEPDEPRTPLPPASAITVIRPGMLTTVQDLGRWGHQRVGIPVAGPMDLHSHRCANSLVGNDETAAALEVTLIGPELRMTGAAICAVAGARFEVTVDGRAVPLDAPFEVPSGGRLHFGARGAGARATLAVRGGFAVPEVFGSRSTSIVSRIGPFGGRALRAGDVLPIGREPRRVRPQRRAIGLPIPEGGARLRVIEGPHADMFEASALRMLYDGRFVVTGSSNRMGYRLHGPGLAHARGADILSDATPIGSIQVPASGQPILLMADRQTTGGYPKIATVIAADLPLAGQLAPGDWIEFRPTTRPEAVAALKRQLARLEGGA